MSFNIAELITKYNEANITIKENEPMSFHTSFKVGGPADIFAVPETIEDLCKAIKLAKTADAPVFILGKGSNILVLDTGIRGVVISTEKVSNISVDNNRMTCECGASLTYSAIVARDAGLAGLAFVYGIPGSVGGAVFMNAGAYGGQMSDVVVKTKYYDTLTDEVCECTEHNFGYRESIYKEHPERIVLSAEFELKEGNIEEIKAEMDDYMERRRSKQPLEYPSAGSTFKRYPGHFTGQLIEECGLKGVRVGGAEVSEKHAGFIINRDNATSEDILGLIQFVKAEIKKKYGFEIECEVITVG